MTDPIDLWETVWVCIWLSLGVTSAETSMSVLSTSKHLLQTERMEVTGFYLSPEGKASPLLKLEDRERVTAQKSKASLPWGSLQKGVGQIQSPSFPPLQGQTTKGKEELD